MPSMTHCPSCQTPVQLDASFCGQCGFNLQGTTPTPENASSALPPTVAVPPGSTSPSIPTSVSGQSERHDLGSALGDRQESPYSPAIPSPSLPTRSPAFENNPSAAPLPPTVAIPPTRRNPETEPPQPPTVAIPVAEPSAWNAEIPDLPLPEPIVHPDPLVAEIAMSSNSEMNVSSPEPSPEKGMDTSQPYTPSAAPASPQITPPPAPPVSPPTVAQVPLQSAPSQTMLQIQVARLLHIQTNTPIELPTNLTVMHLGKPNDRVPPDVDVSGFPNSEIVSRVHADIRVEGDSYYIEDVGSANGTYVNNMPLPVGNRHRLRPGDRIALGKGDKVTFLFQIS